MPRIQIAIVLAFIALSSGCIHQQLRFQTNRQANTLNDLYEQQVLDNLAMFKVNPHAVPFFAFPNEGASIVADGVSIAGNPPLNPFFSTLGFNANRGIQSSWVMSPVRDPNKLYLMRCDYQRAIGCEIDQCNECCNRLKDFKGKPDESLVVFQEDGSPILDPRTGQPYIDPETGLSVVDDATGRPRIDPNTGLYKIAINRSKLDCNSSCSVQCGWLCWIDTRRDIPKSCCKRFGHYCGTFVWVKPGYEDHFGRLVLSILDYAVNDPVQLATSTKTVEFYIDQFGNPTLKEDAYGKVLAVVPLDEPVDTALSQRLTPESLTDFKELKKRNMNSATGTENSPEMNSLLRRGKNSNRTLPMLTVPDSPNFSGESSNILRLRQRQNSLSPTFRPQN